jgi:uncharacterized protein (DUF983 family)
MLSKKKKGISLLESIITLKCPKCRKGNLFLQQGLFRFNKILNMPDKCNYCSQVFEIEPGFWIGALWTSYPLIVTIELPFLLMALLSTNISPWVSFGLMLVAFLFFYPLILRIGRSIWIHISIRYDNSKIKN